MTLWVVFRLCRVWACRVNTACPDSAVQFELVDSITAKLLYTNSEMSTAPLGGKYLSKIDAVGISPACVYVRISKYAPLNKFRLIFCPESRFPSFPVSLVAGRFFTTFCT